MCAFLSCQFVPKKKKIRKEKQWGVESCFYFNFLKQRQSVVAVTNDKLELLANLGRLSTRKSVATVISWPLQFTWVAVLGPLQSSQPSPSLPHLADITNPKKSSSSHWQYVLGIGMEKMSHDKWCTDVYHPPNSPYPRSSPTLQDLHLPPFPHIYQSSKNSQQP